MRRPLSDSEVIGASLGTIVAMCVTGVLGAMRPDVSQANAGLVLVLVIIAAASIGGRWAGGATALAAALSFDFFLTRPYGSLAIKSPQDVVTTVLLFAVGVTVGHFADARWAARASSRAGTDDVAELHRVATLTADGANLVQVLEEVQRTLAEILHLDVCRFEALPPDPPLPVMDPNGKVDAPYVHLGDGFALPADGFVIAVRDEGRPIGWITCIPAVPAVGVSRDRRRTALILVEHLALALSHRDASAA